MIDLQFCMSSYLAFRYVWKQNVGWKEGVIPKYPNPKSQGTHTISSSKEILSVLRRLVTDSCKIGDVGILLSGGIDSAILAALMPQHTQAYTIRFIAKTAIDESEDSKIYSEILGLNHHIIDVKWEDYLENIETVMKKKNSPLHAAEIALYIAAKKAKKDGIETLMVGNGADSTFGGMDKLLSKDWTFQEFVDRYTFVKPSSVLKKPVSMVEPYRKYQVNDGVDVNRFLKTHHGLGIIQMFENGIHSAGCEIAAPYEKLSLGVPLDIERIRAGESKYLLRSVFTELFPSLGLPEKIPFARPMDEWMSNYSEHNRPEFKDELSLGDFSGEQKWIILCLETFLNMLEV
jgi:hypothetical protein